MSEERAMRWVLDDQGVDDLLDLLVAVGGELGRRGVEVSLRYVQDDCTSEVIIPAERR